MPKQKTNKSAAKRFKVTASGRVKRGQAFKSHILTKKTRKRKRKLDMPGMVSDADAPRIKKMIGAA